MQLGILLRSACAAGATAFLAGCASMYGGASIADDSLKSEISAALGLSPAELTIVSRRSEGVNTYVNVKTKAGKEMVCRITGGGVMMMGFKTPPACNDLASGRSETGDNCNDLLRAAGQCGTAAGGTTAAASASPAPATASAPKPAATTAASASAATPASVVPVSTGAAPVTAGPMDRARIAKAQARLRELGFDAGTADGAAGTKTVQALRQFQAARKLQVTGAFDAATVRELGI